MIPRHTHPSHETQRRLEPVVIVTEEWKDWIRGHHLLERDITVEISFETTVDYVLLPGTKVTYMALWRSRGCVFEYSLGKISHMPQVDDWHRYVEPLIACLQDYRPYTPSGLFNQRMSPMR